MSKFLTTGVISQSYLPLIALGGIIEDDGDYRYHIYTSSADFEVTNAPSGKEIEYLVVAGGGPGGYSYGGGGGAGGLLSGSFNPSAETYNVVVGAGGVASLDPQVYGTDGDDSWIKNTSETVNIEADGGGAGGNGWSFPNPGRNGGSGGGGGPQTDGLHPGGSGISGQGKDGGDANGNTENNNLRTGGGGGGASEIGENGTASKAGDGGDGATWTLPSSIATYHSVGEVISDAVWFAGGGGGSFRQHLVAGIGGKGGGGNGTGHDTDPPPGEDGEANTGGGGGAGKTWSDPIEGGNGGSGVVIVRYKIK